ncbi:MAG: phosphoglucosamine mutase [Elainellaceae cyanobacterium]
MVLSAVSSHGGFRSGSQRASDIHPIEIGTWHPLVLPSGRLFGTDGIRGHAGKLLTASLAMQVGFWAGRILQQSGQTGAIIVGQDSRNSSEALSLSLSAGLTAAGLEVWNLGLCPTPAVAYLTNATSAIGGVMVSASHNPPEDNGIKFFGENGAKLSPDVQAQIEASLRGQTVQPISHRATHPMPQWNRYIDRSDLLERYVYSLRQSFHAPMNLQGMKIVLDLAWGAATCLAPIAFQHTGAEVICIHDQPDGDRINVNCGSTHLESLKAAVKNQAADLGFAFDGDADRVVAIDAQGRVVDGDYILYLWGQSLREANQLPGNAIVSTVMANLGFERAWQAQGGTLIRTAVGDQHVHAEMLRRGSVLGGEQSGHILCRHYGISGDGVLTALHLAALVSQSGVSLADLREQSFKTYPQLLQNVRVEDGDRRLGWNESESLHRAIRHAEAEMGDRGRVLVRASGTEPVIRVMVEAETTELVQQWMQYLVSAVQDYAAA